MARIYKVPVGLFVKASSAKVAEANVIELLSNLGRDFGSSEFVVGYNTNDAIVAKRNKK